MKRTKAFAQRMITDHQTSDELKQLVEGGTVQAPIPTAMAEAHPERLKKLEALQGDEFTEATAQVDVHEDAVDLFQRYGSEGDNG